jgi:hypothetical protein
VRVLRLSVTVLASLALLAIAGSARAKCPERDPADPACEPIVSLLMPDNAGGAYYGGGVEFALLSWASNSDAFGPSHGRLRATFTYLFGPEDRHAALYRIGGVVSFEGNASRRFFIPYFTGALGGLYQSDLGGHMAADASLGLYFVYTRNFVLDGEGGYVLPFTSVDALIGPRAQLTASFALW